MIEKIVLDYLLTELSVPVVMEKPKTVPEEYVLIEKTGSGVENLINRATLAIQSVSSLSLYRAATLNETVKEAMDSIITLPAVSKSKLNSDYNFTNTETKEYRYQAVYDLVF